ncbi:MAG: tetratricopeptide repeat protein [Bacteroidaceae bacterium]|jgi:TolA-binding protein
MKNPLSYLLLAACMTLGCGALSAQGTSSAAANRYLEEGAAYYQAGNYAAAKQSLTRFLARSVRSEASEEARYLLCCCSYALQEPERVAQMRQFIRRYPSSRMRHHVAALLGSTLYYEQDYEGAAEAFASCKWDYLPSAEAAQDFRLQQGLSLLALGRNTEALAVFTELAGETERYDRACRYYIATIYYLEADYRPALAGFLELADEPGYAFRASCRAADIYLKNKQYAQAVARCPQGTPDAAEAAQTPAEEQPLLQAEPHRIRGEALYYTGQYAEAVDELEQYTAQVERPAREALYALGASYLECGAPLKAEQILAQVTAGGHTNDALAQSAYLKQGHARLALQERGEAQEAFERAAALDFDPQVKEEADFNIALAAHQDKRESYAARAARWEGFLQEYPASAYRGRATGYLAELYLNDFPAGEALERLRAWGAQDSSLLRAHQIVAARMGMAAVEKEPAEALRLLDESLQIGIDAEARTQALYWRGEAHYRAGGAREAEKDFKNYIALSGGTARGGYAQAYYNLGYLAFNAQRYAEADSLFSLYLQAEPERALRADALCRIGDCRYQRRAFDEALAAYRAAAEADATKRPYALYQEAYMAGVRKDYATKIGLLEQLTAQYPQDETMPDALYELGRAYVLTGANDKALGTYEQLMGRFPQSDKARLAATERSMLLAQAGRTDEAAAAYKAIAERYPGTAEAQQSLQELKSWAVENRQVGQYLAYADTLQGGRYAVGAEEKEALMEVERAALEQEAEARRMAETDSLYEAGALEGLQQMAAAPDSARESAAKAHYLLCQLMYDRGEKAEAEKALTAFIDGGSTQAYWMARHFILLAEVCRAEGRKAEARGYLQGLKETYAGEDDIAERIEKALGDLE